jgi:putative phage-type endonuclease
MIVYNCEQGSEAWFAARCGRVTGTRFKELMAGESTDTYKKLVSNLACEIITGKMEETYSNANMEHGTETEPFARFEYESIFDVEVKQVGFIIPDEDHNYHELIGISPDGLLPEDGLLEIKCPIMRTHLEYIEAGKLPTEYRNQVQGQLFVTGFKYLHFMSYVEGMKPFIIPVKPDIDLFLEFEKRLDLLKAHLQNKLLVYKQYQFLNHE